jgi:hypothetical protein
MSLKKEIKIAMPETMVSAPDRLQQLYDQMNDLGVMCMTTEELEEWSFLMAQSLEGKGNPCL